jgi:mono/diheme cytochrome c family protein
MTKKLYCVAAISALAFPFIHPFGPVKQQHSSALLPGVAWNNAGDGSPASAQNNPQDSARVLQVFERACQNCHSERTQWPLYSYLPVVSWALEKDVAEARQHLDLSHWDQYSVDQQRDLLARIGTEVRNGQMPLPRYTLLHPEARLSEAEIQLIYEWTKAQRRSMRSHLE